MKRSHCPHLILSPIRGRLAHFSPIEQTLIGQQGIARRQQGTSGGCAGHGRWVRQPRTSGTENTAAAQGRVSGAQGQVSNTSAAQSTGVGRAGRVGHGRRVSLPRGPGWNRPVAASRVSPSSRRGCPPCIGVGLRRRWCLSTAEVGPDRNQPVARCWPSFPRSQRRRPSIHLCACVRTRIVHRPSMHLGLRPSFWCACSRLF